MTSAKLHPAQDRSEPLAADEPAGRLVDSAEPVHRVVVVVSGEYLVASVAGKSHGYMAAHHLTKVINRQRRANCKGSPK